MLIAMQEEAQRRRLRGVRAIEAALADEAELRLLLCPEGPLDESVAGLVRACEEAGVSVQRVSPEVLRRLGAQPATRVAGAEAGSGQEMIQRIARVDREKSVELETLGGDLVKLERAAQVQAIQIEKSADAFAATRRAEGEALRSEFIANARGLTEKYSKEAEGIESKAKALEQRGEVVVREALIEKLLNIRFTLVPYSRDPAPKRLEHVDARGAETLLDDSVTERQN